MINTRFLQKIIFCTLLSFVFLFCLSHRILKLAEGERGSLDSILIKRYSTDWKATGRTNNAILKVCKNLTEEEGFKKVICRGQSRIPIQNANIASARRMAIALAIRDAVEKGYGSYVNLKNLPNRREVLQRASAQLVYSIVKEEAKDNFYQVTIEAEILVPLDLIKEFPVSPPSPSIPPEYKPFIAKHPHGEINWGQGYILAEGMAAVQEDNPPQQALLLSRRAALVDAEANILEIIYNIRIDSGKKIGEAVSKDDPMVFKVKGFIRNAEVVEEGKKGNIYRVEIRVPLKGVQGLGIMFYQLAGKEAAIPSEKPKIKPKEKKEIKITKPPAEEQVEAFAAVVIDASATGFKSCLYPEIVTEQGMEVYSVKQVAEESLVEKGMAAYAVIVDTESWLREGRNSLIAIQRKASRIRPASSSTLPLYLINNENYVYPFFKGISLEDSRTLLIRASKAAGRLKGTIVISQTEGEGLLAIDEKIGLLRDCKVIIVVSAMEEGKINSGFWNLRANQMPSLDIP